MTRTRTNIAAAILLTACLLLATYSVKCHLGIDLFPGAHLTDFLPVGWLQ